MDKNDIIEYVMHTPHNTNRAVLSSMLNQLAEGGGGGSSDFSTAEVTVVNNTDSYQSVTLMSNYISNHAMTEYISAVRITDEYGASNDHFTEPLGVNGGESINVDVYLISGKNFSAGANGEGVTITLAGQAEESYVVAPDESHLPVILITGDCTITIS